jgi:hypothetical protein
MALFSSTQPSLRARILAKFPARVIAGTGISITKANGSYTFGLDNLGGSIMLQPVAVSALPAAGSMGRRAFVTDSTVTTFGNVVAAGGANKVPVYDDGTNWRIG